MCLLSLKRFLVNMKSKQYSKQNLEGKKIVLTRSSHQMAEISEELKKYGAIPIEVPTIKIIPPLDEGEKLRAVISRLHNYEWIIFTSVNGVDQFMSALHEIEKLEEVHIAAIGTGTERKLAQFHVSVDLVPENQVAEGLLGIFPEPRTENRVLLPRASKGRSILPDSLTKLGWVVDDVPTYRTVVPEAEEGSTQLLELADVIVFTSSSTVKNFMKMFGQKYLPQVVVSIGPVTSQTIIDSGFKPTLEASPSSIKGIIQSLTSYYSNN